MLKRYWLFSWEDYEAGGGMHDFHLDYDTIENGEEDAPPFDENGHIFDSELKKIVSDWDSVIKRWVRVDKVIGR